VQFLPKIERKLLPLISLSFSFPFLEFFSYQFDPEGPSLLSHPVITLLRVESNAITAEEKWRISVTLCTALFSDLS
jgi:hypothetical protein